MSGSGVRKKIAISPTGLGAALLIGLAVGIRLALIAQGWPLVDSDEGTMGVMAIHISQWKSWPIFFYGQFYMGSTEAYIGAYLFQLFGPTAFSLRLGILLFYTVFLIGIYHLTKRLYNRAWALVVLLLLAFGSNPMLIRQLVAVGGNPEMLVAGTFLMLLATNLALTARQQSTRRRSWMFAIWGGLVGFGVWSHLLVLPFVLMSFLILLFFCRADLFWKRIWQIVAGFVVGALPLIIYNIIFFSKNTLIVFLTIHSVEGHYTSTLWQQLQGAFLIALPTATGAIPLCTPTDVLVTRNTACILTHAGWSLGETALWGTAVVLAVVALWGFWKTRTSEAAQTPERYQEVVRQFSRLALLGVAGVTVLMYVLSPNAAWFPVPTSRYFYGLLAVTPAVLWPLWRLIQVSKPWVIQTSKKAVTLRLSWLSKTVGTLGLAIVLCVLVFGTVIIFTGNPRSQEAIINATEDHNLDIQDIDQHYDLPATQQFNANERALIEKLQSLQIKHIYSDYWSCNRLTFRSQEQIICAVVNDVEKHSGYNRYDTYRMIVEADPYASYVYTIGSPQQKVMESYLLKAPDSYDVYTAGGYKIYRPR